MELNKIYNEDCMAGMKKIPDESIDCVITDPPYRTTPRGGSKNSMSGYWISDLANKGKIFEDNDIEIEEYLPELYRVLKDGSHCYIMCNNLNLPHFFEVIGKSKFHFVKLLVWDKQTKICGRYFMGQVEFIFLLRKGSDRPINDCGISDLLSYANRKDKDPRGNNLHNSQKPLGLIRALVHSSTNIGDVVLDPFMGSGTTAVACAKSNRDYIGFEINKEFYERAVERIGIESAQQTIW